MLGALGTALRDAGHVPTPTGTIAWRAWGLLPCLLSVLFLPGTPVPPTASTEALPTVQLSNASLAFRPGSLSPEPSSLFPAELCVSVPLTVLLLFLTSRAFRVRRGLAWHLSVPYSSPVQSDRQDSCSTGCVCVVHTCARRCTRTDAAVGSEHGALGTCPSTARALLAQLQSVSTSCKTGNGHDGSAQPPHRAGFPAHSSISTFAEGVRVDRWPSTASGAPFSREESVGAAAQL